MSCVMVLWLAVAMAAAGLPGIVLCIGSDGHFSIESAREGQCRGEGDAQDHRRHTEAELIADAKADCCGDCTDVPLSSDGNLQPLHLLRYSDTVGSVLPVLSHAVLCAGPHIDFGTKAEVLPMIPTRPAASVLEQLSVILRI